MGNPVVLAVDIGTSSVRAALYSREGGAAGLTQKHHGVLRPAPFMEEQDPDAVRALVYDTVADCLAKSGKAGDNVRGLTFSSQMYSVFPVDAAGRPLHNSILWSDARAEETACELKRAGVANDIYHVTGCPVNSIYPLAKILWLRRHRPEAWEKAARFVSIKDYVLQPLIGDWVADHSMASGSGMLDLERNDWSELALSVTGLTRDRLPRLASGTEPITVANGALLKRWGLPESTPVFLGGGDGPLANIGSGAAGPGGINIDLGTSGAMRAAVDTPLFDAEGRLWCYAMFPGRWAFGGIITNVGNAMQWLGTNIAFAEENIEPDAAAARIGVLAGGAPPGSGGVFCLPFFRKARSPYWDDRLCGTVFGLSAVHTIRHVARAALEAIAYDLAVVKDIIETRKPLSDPVVLTGGLSRNETVPQLLADVLDAPVFTPELCEGSLSGAAILGLHGAGLLDGYAFDRASPPAGTRFDPRRETAARYRSLRERYAELVEAVKQLDFSKLEQS